MAQDPFAANYGRGQAGQFSPYRDQPAQRRRVPYDEENEAQQAEQPVPLAQAVMPRQRFTTQASEGLAPALAGGGSGMSPLAQAVQPRQSQGFLPTGRDNPINTSPLQVKSGSFESVMGGVVGRMPDTWTEHSAGLTPAASASKQAPWGVGILQPGIDPEAYHQASDAVNQQIGPAAQAKQQSQYGSLDKPVGLGQYQLEGYNYDRFGDPNGRGNNTWKYKVGSVMSNYPPTAEGGAAAAAQLQSMGVDVQFDGKDKFIFGPSVIDEGSGQPIGTIDVIRGAGAEGSGWAWQPQDGLSNAPLASAVGGDYADPAAQELARLMGIDTSNPMWKQILDKLIADQSGQAAPSEPLSQFYSPRV